jgi:sugar lactone lactonase YvrE
MTVSCVADSACTLGEGPLWDAGRGLVWWVDIHQRRLWRLDPVSGESEGRDLPVQATALAMRRAGDLLMAAREGIGLFDPDAWVFTPRLEPEADRTLNRTNDGNMGRDGAFWFGSMHETASARSGAIYRLTSDWTCTRVLDGWGIANTLSTDAEGRRLYLADSLDQTLYAYEIEAGRLGARRTLVGAHGQAWTPDGSAVDADGNLWNARWDGWGLACQSPDGDVLRELPLPIQRPTSACFGGPNLATLYITSARDDLTPAQLAGQPLAGGLFAADVGVRGLALPAFEG